MPWRHIRCLLRCLFCVMPLRAPFLLIRRFLRLFCRQLMITPPRLPAPLMIARIFLPAFSMIAFIATIAFDSQIFATPSRHRHYAISPGRHAVFRRLPAIAAAIFDYHDIFAAAIPISSPDASIFSHDFDAARRRLLCFRFCCARFLRYFAAAATLAAAALPAARCHARMLARYC